MKSFFDEENRMEKISKIGDPLEILNSIINWEMFRVILKKHIVRKESNQYTYFTTTQQHILSKQKKSSPPSELLSTPITSYKKSHEKHTIGAGSP